MGWTNDGDGQFDYPADPGTGLQHPWIASGGSEYGLVWADTSLGGPEVFFSRLNASAAPTGTILRVSP